MAFEFVNSSFTDSASSTSIVVDKPTNTTDDDIIFALIHRPSGGSPTGVPSGWTLLGSSPATPIYFLYWKLASSEGSNYTRTFTGSVKTSIVITTYRGGFDTADPIDVVSNTAYTTVNATIRAASMDVTASNSPIIFLGTMYRTSQVTFTPPTSPTTFTEDFEGGSTTSDCWSTVASATRSSSGATGDIDATLLYASPSKHAFAVALTPGGGVGSTFTPKIMMF